MSEAIILDGENLKVKDLWDFARKALNPKSTFAIEIAPEAKTRIQKAEAFVEKIIYEKRAVYGVNTGFGKFAEVAIKEGDLIELQYNLIRSHSAGIGRPLSRDIAMAMWIIRLNTFCRGQSGVRWSTVEKIIQFLEKGFLAVIPSRGSVGASGDLAPSAHATLALIGEGMATIPSGDGFTELPAEVALELIKLPKLELGPKEGISLINGTQLTTALAAQVHWEGTRALRAANAACAMSIEGLRASSRLFADEVLICRNQPGTLHCGREMATWLEGPSEITKSHVDCGRVQDPYSLRCAPQVHGAIKDELDQCEEIIAREINASTDNPLLFPEIGESISGGNFHAIYTARVNDRLASALTTLGVISERRIALAMSPESSRLPAFLIENGGLHSGFMMAQVTAAAIVSEAKTLCFPASVDSIPTSDDREDHVSMGPGAGFKALKIAKRLQRVLAIEFLAGAQAIDLLAPLKTTTSLQRLHEGIRKVVRFLDADRALGVDIESMVKLLKSPLIEECQPKAKNQS